MNGTFREVNEKIATLKENGFRSVA